MNINQKQKQQLIQYYPELRTYFDLQDIKERRPEADAILVALINKIQTLKGDKGDMPVKGIDYWTDEELNQVIAYILKESTPVKGIHYKDGEKGDKGDSYVLTSEDRKKIAHSIDVPIVEKVIEKTTIEVLPEDIARTLNTLKNAVDVSVIKGSISKKDLELQDKKVLDGMARIDGRIRLIDMRWRGGGSSSSGGGFTYTDEIVGTGDGDGAGGGTLTFTLANTPKNPSGMFLMGYGGFGSSWKYLQGASYDYTISGKTITFSQAPLSGTLILASYA